MYAAPYAGALASSLLSGWIGHVAPAGPDRRDRRGALGRGDRAFGFAEIALARAALLAAAGAADNVSAVLRGTILWTVTPDTLRAASRDRVRPGRRDAALGNVEAGVVASLTSVRFSIASGGLLCVIGTVVVALAVPGLHPLRLARSRLMLSAAASTTVRRS
jgi:hypothetical protein